MDCARYKLFSRTGLSCDEHSRICSRNFLDVLKNLLNGKRHTDNLLKIMLAFNLFLKINIFCLKFIFQFFDFGKRFPRCFFRAGSFRILMGYLYRNCRLRCKCLNNLNPVRRKGSGA